jgi:hypothetical protein
LFAGVDWVVLVVEDWVEFELLVELEALDDVLEEVEFVPDVIVFEVPLLLFDV